MGKITKPAPDVSRGNWTLISDDDGRWETKDLHLSLMFRSVEAMEAMAQNHEKILADLEYYKVKSHDKGLAIEGLNRSLATTKGHLTRAKTRSEQRNKMLNAVTDKVKEIMRREGIGVGEINRLGEIITAIKDSI